MNSRSAAAAVQGPGTQVTVDVPNLTITIKMSHYMWGPGWDRFVSDSGGFEQASTALKEYLDAKFNDTVYSKYKCYKIKFEYEFYPCSTAVGAEDACPAFSKVEPYAKGSAIHSVYWLDAVDPNSPYHRYGAYECTIRNAQTKKSRFYTSYGVPYNADDAKLCYDYDHAHGDTGRTAAFTYEVDLGNREVTLDQDGATETITGSSSSTVMVNAYTGSMSFQALNFAHESMHMLGVSDHTSSGLMRASKGGSYYVALKTWHEVLAPLAIECVWEAAAPWEITTSQDTYAYPGRIYGGELCLKLESNGLKVQGTGCTAYVAGSSTAHTVRTKDDCEIKGRDYVGDVTVTNFTPDPKSPDIVNDVSDDKEIVLYFIPKILDEASRPREEYTHEECKGKTQLPVFQVEEYHLYNGLVTADYLDEMTVFKAPNLGAAVGKTYTAGGVDALLPLYGSQAPDGTDSTAIMYEFKTTSPFIIKDVHGK